MLVPISGLLGGCPFFGDPPTGLTPEPRNSPPQHPPPFPQELITSTLTTHDHCSNRNPTTRPQYIQSTNQSTHPGDPMSLTSLWLPTHVEELPAHEHNRSNLLLRCTAGRRTLHSDLQLVTPTTPSRSPKLLQLTTPMTPSCSLKLSASLLERPSSAIFSLLTHVR